MGDGVDGMLGVGIRLYRGAGACCSGLHVGIAFSIGLKNQWEETPKHPRYLLNQ